MRKHFIHLLWLLPLLVGCGGYRSVVLVDDAARVPSRPLAPGDEVALRLDDGARLFGEVSAIDADSLTLIPRDPFSTTRRPAARFDTARDRVAWTEIREAERLRDRKWPGPFTLGFLSASILLGLWLGGTF